MLDGKFALVTGGGRGIGRAVAVQLAQQGAMVVVCSKTKKQIDETVAIIVAEGGEAQAVECDVSAKGKVEHLFAHIRKDFGRLDILVNCAGIFFSRRLEDTSPEEFNHVMTVNVNGVFLCSREAFRLMKVAGGSIVNVSSLSGVKGTEKFPGFGAYCASKFAVVGLTEVLAVEGRECGIRANAVAPGAVDTEMIRSAFPGAEFPLLSAEQVANTIVYLAGPQSSGISGTCIELFSDLLKK